MTEKPGVATRLMYQLFVALNRKKVSCWTSYYKQITHVCTLIDASAFVMKFCVFALFPAAAIDWAVPGVHEAFRKGPTGED